MTRINVVPVDELTDNFLRAEYWELPRIFVLARKHFDAGKKPEDLDIPDSYRLGEGHMRFFYDKLMYLCTRHYLLGIEMLKRGLDPQIDPGALPINLVPMINREWWKNFAPNMQDIQINRDRLQYRRRYEGGAYSKG